MIEDWMTDGRKIPDEVMNYIRKMAVYAVKELNESPETVARVFNINRHCIYRWLKQYNENDYKGLETVTAPGATPLITQEMDNWLKETILNKMPMDFGYDTHLWTSRILKELLRKQFYIEVTDDAVSLHLKALGLTYQKPRYQDKAQKSQEVDYFLNHKFPQIQRLAAKLGADIAFEDESGVGVQTRSGRTWGLKGQTPVIPVTTQRGGFNVLSTVTAQGKMSYSLAEKSIDSVRYIKFLKQLIKNREKPLILLADNVSFHNSKAVREFVKKNRTKLRVFFLPKHSPELNPDEQVWHEIKDNKIGKQPIKSKADLKERLKSELASLQKNTKRIASFFCLKDTEYAACPS